MRKYEHLLLATDFSDISRVAAQQAVDLAEHYGARITFLHVVEHFPEHLPHYHMIGDGEQMDPEEFLIDRAKKDLQDLCTELAPNATAAQEVRLTKHSAKAEIVDFAKHNDVDLIVLGARGRRNLLDMLSGSTATGVARAAPCDTFVVNAATETVQDAR